MVQHSPVPAQAPGEGFLIAVNPDAGGARLGIAAAVAEGLRAHGRRVVVEEAARPGQIRHLAENAPAGALLVAGGDGSINEAVRGLLSRQGPRPQLGVIPQGTVNVLWRELGLPRDGGALADIFSRGATKQLHVGRANGRPFTLMASAGLDAAVVAALDPALKQRIGRLAYAAAAARILASGDFPEVEAQTDAGDLRAKCVIVANASYYGGSFVIDREADVTQPGLRLVALTEISPRATFALLRYFASGRVDAAGCVRKLAVRRVALRGAGVVAQIDGDFLGPAPIEICEARQTLEILA